MNTPVLTPVELEQALRSLPLWQVQNGELNRTFTFKDFKSAMAFVNNVADQAELAGHHPDIDIRYNKVRIALVTHDAGGISARDVNLASLIDRL